MKLTLLTICVALLLTAPFSRGQDNLPQNGLFAPDSGTGSGDAVSVASDVTPGLAPDERISSVVKGTDSAPDPEPASGPTTTTAAANPALPQTGLFSEANAAPDAPTPATGIFSKSTEGTAEPITVASQDAGGGSTGGPAGSLDLAVSPQVTGNLGPATGAGTNSPQNGIAVAANGDAAGSDSALPQSGTTATATSPNSISTPPATQPGDITLTPENPVPSNPLPPLPKLEVNLPRTYPPVLPPLNPTEGGALFEPQIYVKEFHFKGNHVYSSATLAELLKKYSGRKITSDELESARQIVTLYYVSHGYINSGAVLPDQNPKDGIILFQVVEGRLTQVQVTGQHWFQVWWIRNMMRQAAGTPLNFNDLKTGMQVLRENPNIAQVNAELKPGGVPGESKLVMEVKDNMPFHFSVELNNYRPPSVGSLIAEAHASDLNLTGNNDPLTLTYGFLNSDQDGVQFSHLDNAAADYRFPILPWGTTMELGADRNNAGIIQQPFSQLDITSKLTEYHLSIHQPIIDTPQRTFVLSFGVDDRRNETSLFGQPFSLSPGAVNGVEQVFVPRFVQEFVDRSQVHVFSLRSQVSVGLGVFNSTINPGPPDGHFVDWLGQAQYIRRLDTWGNLFIFRLNGQIADRPLLSLEQYELGGISSVRGYLENQALRDNGLTASAELRLPLLEDKDHNAQIALAPFTDFGVGWDNVETTGTGPAALNNLGTQAVAMPSVGIGLLLNPWKYISGQIYWGYALNRRQVTEGGGLQNNGIEFSVMVNAF